MNDVFLLVGRSLRTYLRQPAALIPNTAISVFFLFVYNAGLSSVSELPGFEGSYLAFILPVAIVSAAIGGASIAGDALVRDSESGYFTKLLLTPTQRLAIIWGPMIAGGVILVAQVTLIIVIALFMGLTSATGPLGYLVIIAFAFLWGMAFSGYSVWFALRTRSGAATQAATLVFFPLIFLSSTFVPEEYITAGWLKVATRIESDHLRVRRHARGAHRRLGGEHAPGRARRGARLGDADRRTGPVAGEEGHQAHGLRRSGAPDEPRSRSRPPEDLVDDVGPLRNAKVMCSGIGGFDGAIDGAICGAVEGSDP